jgi:DNA polymerase-3 subunit gamma/tau
LLVELGLMKIASLGQKKNEEVGFESFDISIPLPDLDATAQQRATTNEVQTPTQPTPAPVGVNTPAPTPAKAIEEVQEAPAASPEPKRRPTTTTRVKTSSISLNQLLSGGAKTASEISEEESAKAERNEIEIDPQCEEKLNLAKEKIIEALLASRPRIGSRFEESMMVEGNTVKIEVQSQELFNEIMQQKSDIQKLMSSLCGARGYIELEVIVNEQIKASRPITLEDRLKHLITRNERLVEMLDILGLDAE